MKLRLLFFLFAMPAITVAVQPNALQDPAALDVESLVYLEQNWSEEERHFFYFTDQGSRFMPYDLFVYLEQADSSELFSSPVNLLRYGYLPASASPENPDALPVGFISEDGYMGFTCAACHTQQIKYKGKYIRIDGGQAMADFPAFRYGLTDALEATLNDQARLQRLAGRIYGKTVDDKKLGKLRKRVSRELEKQSDYNRRNHTDVAYGFSRLDAFGAILNKGLQLAGGEDNFNPPNAPTSYPYLWDTPQHDYVEWNGSQANSNVGALARNVGEVIGVFGQVDPTPRKWLFFIDGGYASSIQAKNLRNLEKTISRLTSPEWPDVFPAIDQQKANAGRKLYSQYCLSCHQDIDRTDPVRNIRVRMSSLEKIGTDPLMARNALEYSGQSGIFEGTPRFYDVGEILGTTVPALYIVNNVMVGVLKNNVLQTLLARRDARSFGHGDEIHPPKYLDGKVLEEGTEVSEKALLAYKARPLNGIWSGAPYLHNGSVPNLYQLMLPAEKRVKTFYIGSWEYDPVNVGYVMEPSKGAFLFDTTLPGNSNAGHEYGTGYDGLPALNEQDIRNLIEYMKTL